MGFLFREDIVKVCFWGNQGNNAYRLCKWVREKGLDACLYKMSSDSESMRSQPEVVDRDLGKSYPSWIHNYDNRHFRMVYVPKKVKDFIQKEFDILIACGNSGSASAHNFNIPILSYILGGEGVWGRFLFDPKINRTLTRRLKKSLMTFYYKKTIRKSEKLISGYDPVTLSLHSIGQSHKQSFYGFPEDVLGNKERVDSELIYELNNQYNVYDKVFLWLSRVNFLDKNNSEYKGTEKFLFAVDRLIKKNKPNIKVLVGEHGSDVQNFKQMVKEKGLETFFEYIPHLPYWKLLTYLSIENAIVFDELSHYKSSTSGMFREALSVSAVLIKSHNETLTTIGYGPNCPVLDATSTEETYKMMLKVLSWDKTKMCQKKEEIDKWATKYLHWETHIDKFINMLRKIYYTEELAKSYKRTH